MCHSNAPLVRKGCLSPGIPRFDTLLPQGGTAVALTVLLRPVIQFKPIEGDGALAQGDDRDAGTYELIEEVLVHPQVRGSCTEAARKRISRGGNCSLSCSRRKPIAHLSGELRLTASRIALEAWGARALNVTNLRAYERCGRWRLESHPARLCPTSRRTEPTGDDLQHPATRASQTLKCVIYSSSSSWRNHSTKPSSWIW
jgi:hypothetical protein